jgi:radical SAM superfamily enzyme YgiQ (UPF0313 family)
MQPLSAYMETPFSIPDLGLGYIAAALKRNGHHVSVMDFNAVTSPEKFRGRLTDEMPEVLGVKIFTKDVGAAKKTISIIRETLPRSTVVIGGPHPSSESPGELMQDFPDVDFAIRGEAEETLPQLLEGMGDGHPHTPPGNAERINGLVWREGGRVMANPISFTRELDRIDFPLWELFDPADYSVRLLSAGEMRGNTAPIITTRGCPGKCSFCTAYNVNGRRIRFRSPGNVIEEMKLLYNEYGVRAFMFQDNCFTSLRGNLVAICEGVIESGMDIQWDCASYESLRNLTDETLSLMYRAGCRMIHMGIESASERTRKRMNKSCSLSEITEKAGVVRGNGIKVGAWFMVGFPEETRKEMQETIDYALSLGAELVTITPCFPLPGTEVYNYLRERYGIERIDWSDFDIRRSRYPMSELSSVRLAMLLKLVRFRMGLRSRLRNFLARS